MFGLKRACSQLALSTELSRKNWVSRHPLSIDRAVRVLSMYLVGGPRCCVDKALEPIKVQVHDSGTARVTSIQI